MRIGSKSRAPRKKLREVVRWQTQWGGGKADAIAIGHEDRGEVIPDYLFPPELLPGVEEYLNAFWDMTSDCQIGMELGPIPYSSIVLWSEKNGIDGPDEFHHLKRCIRAMEDAWRGGKSQVDGRCPGNLFKAAHATIV